jgi:uncharacterized protein (TIGR02246 family)
MRLSLMAGVFIGAVVVACAKSDQPAAVQQGAATDVSVARRGIDSTNAMFAAAIQRGDSVTLASLYDADAAVLPQGMNVARGHDQIQSTFGGILSQFAISNFSLHTQDVVASGDLAVETGRYAWTLTPKKGKAMIDSGKYVVAWRKQADGSWKLYRDIFNDDAPPAAPAKR